ncbi:hypothetical protein BKA58DRAFT_200212 [Alternaria rosae]|uniref:uncharacterized protein n=1 Tax=Alternaria rosae TaxID=1187941 RepID=UPI001E8EF479|nr:uncharacterized protein BKA58DRAFT_200212 [Alternaria rosae]KAH6868743.1 hypothetical protein BKA58DRAFT_200212 [Alternaria rosae]
MAEYEDSNNALYKYTPRGKLLCSYCMDLHLVSSFDAAETSASSIGATHRRRCTASTTKVYLCPHLQLSFEDLHQLHEIPANSLTCTICTASCTSGAKSTAPRDYCSLSQRMFLPLGSNRYMWPTPGRLPIRGGTLHCDSFFAKLATLSTLLKVIQNANMYICPHVHSKEKVCDMLASMIEDALFRRRKRKHSFYDSAPYKASQFSSCAKPGCIAGVVVRLEETGISIKTPREVKITTVRAESWIVSTQLPVTDARV